MASYAGSEFNDLAKLLFKCLITLTPNFNPSKYLDEFSLKKTDLEKVNFVHNDIKKYPKVFAKFCKDSKDDTRALEHIDSGKIKCNIGNYWDALEDFSRAAASSENDTVLALAYGYRSECFINLKMPNECLKEIQRARPYFPRDMLEVLDHREKEAQEMDPNGRQYYQGVMGSDSFDANPSIQSANNCVRIKHSLKTGSYVCATRDIEIGEIVAIERPFATTLTSNRLTHCHHCLNLCYNPVPCSGCTVALFCNDQCKSNARNYHKFECPILLTICYRVLCEFAVDDSMLLVLKLALLGKDDSSQSDPLFSKDKQLYRSDRSKEIHLLEPQWEPTTLDLFHRAILTSIIFELLWTHTSFFSGIFSTSDTNDKFKEVMLKLLRITSVNSAKIYEYVFRRHHFNGTENFGTGAYSFFPLFSHSCCANVMKTYHGTTMVLRALNTIKAGDQCYVNRYGYDLCPQTARDSYILTHHLPKCICSACKGNWVATPGTTEEICKLLEIEETDLGGIIRNVIGTDVDKAETLLPILVQELKKCENLEPQGNALLLKSLIVQCYVIAGNKRVEETQRDIVLAP